MELTVTTVGGLTLASGTFPPGYTIEESSGRVLVILSGSMTVEEDGVEIAEVCPFDLFVLTPGSEAVVTGDEHAVVLDLGPPDDSDGRSGKAGVRSAKAGVRSGKAGVRSAKAGVRSGKAGVRSAKAGVRSGKAGVRSAKAGVRSAKAGVRSKNGYYEERRDAALDPEAWTENVAELIRERSVVMRLGARIVPLNCDLPLPTIEAHPTYGAPDPDAGDAGRPKVLKPRENALIALVPIKNSVLREALENPEVAQALQEDLAAELALQMDRAFLSGQGDPDQPGPKGIRHQEGIERRDVLGAVSFADLLAMVPGAAGMHRRFLNPGWVLSPGLLAQLAALSVGPTILGNTRLLALDEAGGGTLLGFPICTLTGLEGIYFSSDWQEAWIGEDEELEIDISEEAAFGRLETVFRAVIRHDFALRRPELFTFQPIDHAAMEHEFDTLREKSRQRDA